MRSDEREDEDSAFPVAQLAVLAICRIAEPIAFVSIIAYSFLMVQDIKGKEDASFYAGLLVSAFAMAEASTTMFWGALSDRHGRKPIVLVALAGTALSSLLFGFAKNYWVAILARVVGGLLNGSIAVMQTMVAEMVKKPEHEPIAYAIQPFMWNLGSIGGAALGGFLARPCDFYPDLFPRGSIFDEFPYLLPNLVSVVMIILAIIQAALFLRETNPVLKVKVNHSTSDASAVDERTALQRQQQPQLRQHRNSPVDLICPDPGLPAYVTSGYVTSQDATLDLRRSPVGSGSTFRPLTNPASIAEIGVEDDEEEPERPIKAFNHAVIMWIVALALMCYHQMAFGALIPIYLLDDPRRRHGLDLIGGLGLSLHDVGVYLAVNSVISLVVQGLIFPLYVGYFGVWESVVSLIIFCPLVQILMPFVTALPDPGIGVYIFMTLQSIATIVTYPALLILLKNATESPKVLGRVNGLAMSACSAARTISPPLVGIFYAELGSAGAWWSCAVVAIAAIIELWFTPRPKEKNGEVVKRASFVGDDVSGIVGEAAREDEVERESR